MSSLWTFDLATFSMIYNSLCGFVSSTGTIYNEDPLEFLLFYYSFLHKENPNNEHQIFRLIMLNYI